MRHFISVFWSVRQSIFSAAIWPVISIVFILVSVFKISGCSQSVSTKNTSGTQLCSVTSPSTVIQFFLLEYDQEENKTYFEAVLRTLTAFGPSIEIDSPCTLSANTTTLNKRNFDFTRYVSRATGAAATTTFTFKDALENTWSNQASLAVVAFNPAPAVLSLAATTTTITFTPAADLTDYADNTLLEITDSKTNPRIYLPIRPKKTTGSNTSTTFEITNDPASTTALQYSFPALQPMFMRLVREVRTIIATDAAGSTGGGGVIISRYYTTYESITVNP